MIQPARDYIADYEVHSEIHLLDLHAIFGPFENECPFTQIETEKGDPQYTEGVVWDMAQYMMKAARHTEAGLIAPPPSAAPVQQPPQAPGPSQAPKPNASKTVKSVVVVPPRSADIGIAELSSAPSTSSATQEKQAKRDHERAGLKFVPDPDFSLPKTSYDDTLAPNYDSSDSSDSSSDPAFPGKLVMNEEPENSAPTPAETRRENATVKTDRPSATVKRSTAPSTTQPAEKSTTESTQRRETTQKPKSKTKVKRGEGRRQ